jgi:predicted ribonuclease YlaK
MSGKQKPVVVKALGKHMMQKINPTTDNQAKVFESFRDEKNLMLHGCAGTGKTFIMLYLALRTVLSGHTQYKKVVIVRSMLPIRDIGFLPGTQEEKQAVYMEPYYSLVQELFPEVDNPYDLASMQEVLEFMGTSYIRGITLNDSLIIVDECQNLNYHELDTIITRVGENSRIFFCGDYNQTDLKYEREQNGILKFIDILQSMNQFDFIEFTEDDIVRSGLVRDYIIAKNRATTKAIVDAEEAKKLLDKQLST